ncbi:MAG TPA: fumarylacetoacetate hydrolase family protein [Phycisphaerae bacterium]|nr:fumarylacetoacetate hydrolase family protein [Phycisphaerae bacterium]
MRIARVQTATGQVLTGRLATDDAIEPLEGDLFGPPLRFGPATPFTRRLAPVVPPNIFAIGRNYRAHAEETGSAVPEKPLIFMKATTALADPEGAIRIPAAAPAEVDFEAELVIVIGRRARRVSEAAALDYVLGYTCGNDVSARDCQRNDKQWARAKGFDTFAPLGPWIVTADALDPDDCIVRSRLNGRVMQDSSTRHMLHSCRRLVSYLSEQFTLLPGTLIFTGTPEGVGMARTPPVFLKPGDVIEVEVEGIGVLRSRVEAETGG